MRRGILIAVSIGVLMLLTAQPALAAKPIEHEVVKFDDTIPDEELCGITVDTHIEGHANFLAFGGFQEGGFQDVSHVVVTWTNEDGDWLQLFSTGRVRGEFDLDENGILTITESHSGIQERLRSAAGTTAAFDRGRIVFEIVIDLNDPEDPEDDEFISFEVVFVAGPHPEFESDFALFCEVVTDVLG